MEVCAKAKIGRHSVPNAVEPEIPAPVSLPLYKLRCRHCFYAVDEIETSNAAEAKASAHAAVHGHDVEVKFDIRDCLMTVIRADEVR